MIGTQRGTRMMTPQRSSSGRRSGRGRRWGLPTVVVLLLSLSAGAGGLAPTGVAQATGGTDSTCAQASLQSDLTAGGTWTLDCPSSPTTILFSAPVTVTSGTAALQVAGGKRVALDGGHRTRLFIITGGSLRLSGLTLQNGSNSGATPPDADGGAILNRGTLSVTDSAFSGNSAGDWGGGAIASAAAAPSGLSVSNSTFAGNSARSGGAIATTSGGSVSASTFSGNSACPSFCEGGGTGGALYNGGGRLSVRASAFAGNRAFPDPRFGGAAGGFGGAIRNANGGVSVSDSTFAGNGGSDGGAIFNEGSLSVSASTVAGNSACAGVCVGGAIASEGGTATLRGTIIADNTCAALDGATLTDGGYNLEWQGGGALTCGFTNHAVNNQDPLLGPLQDNGGPTPTMPLGAGSPAIDVIPLASCVDASGAPLTMDQRGFTRPDDSEATCDSGAYESGASAPAPLPFRDGFESGDLAAWSLVKTGPGGNAVVQGSLVKSGRFAARLSATTQPGSYAYAREAFTPVQSHLSASGDIRILAEGASGGTVPLFRLFDGAGNLIASLYRANHTNGQLWVQASGAYRRTTGLVPLNAWAHLELYVATVGANQSTVEVRLNGALIYQNRGLSLGTAGVGTVQLGNEAHQQVFDVVADNIVVQ